MTERETTPEEVIEYFNRIKRNFKARRIEFSEFYITTECLEKLNQIFCANSINVLEHQRTLLGLKIIEINSETKFTLEEVRNIRDKHTLFIDEFVNIFNMRYTRPRLRQW